MCRSSRVLRRAFTIIELLAVTILVGALASLSIPRYRDMLERAKVARAIGDLRTLQLEILAQETLPADLAQIGRAGWLDPWGRPYVYYRFPPTPLGLPPTGARIDRFQVPVNSTFDLYSVGLDGESVLIFSAPQSRDDVVRANDGDYLGLASKY